jgi:hypothetical protein
MNILINTITAWYEPPRARHQVSNELIKSHSVYFIARNEVGAPNIKIEKYGNFNLVIPYFPVDYKYRYRIPLLNELFQHWLFKKTRKIIPEVDYVINFDFTATKIFKYYRNIVYYCNDEYIGNSKYTNVFIEKYHKIAERAVIKKSNFCIATAPFLTNKLIKLNKKTYEIPLGAPDISNYGIKPSGYQNNKKIITVGLVGFITLRNISYDLINQLSLNENFKMILVGPVEKEFMGQLLNPDNIKFTGTLKGRDLYNEINLFDVAIAPYDLNKINPGTSPNKMWQYMALGKPVVITDLPNLSSFHFPEKIIYVAKKYNAFSNLILKAYNENSNKLIDERIQIAQKNRWTEKVKKFERIAQENFCF